MFPVQLLTVALGLAAFTVADARSVSRRNRFSTVDHEKRGRQDLDRRDLVSRSTSWTSLGCIHDGGSRALSGPSTSSNSMTVEMCVDYCSAAGYTYAGLECRFRCYRDHADEQITFNAM